MSDTEPQQTPSPCVLVTGAGRNIGAHLAHRFLDDGFAVIAHYRSESKAIERLVQRGAQAIQGEFAHASTSGEIARRVAEIAPRLRAIVHNASAFAPTREQPADAAAQFQRFFEVHMLAPYILNTQLASHLVADAAAAADIIHITDIYADNPDADHDLYCATKAGLQNLALSFAKRLAPRVKVNAIQPGPISFDSQQDAASRRQILETTPLGCTGTPEAIYAAVRAIMGNDYQTGAVIPVDGGRRLGR